MAKYIIDTHVLIWFLSDSSKLKPEQRKTFKDVNSEFYILSRVFEEIRYKFERFKKINNDKGVIKIPPIIVWRITKKCKNVKICMLDDRLIDEWINKRPELKKIKIDDRPFVVMQLILQKKFPRTEIRIITNDDNIIKNSLTRTI